jgi:hypothetical protein
MEDFLTDIWRSWLLADLIPSRKHAAKQAAEYSMSRLRKLAVNRMKGPYFFKETDNGHDRPSVQFDTFLRRPTCFGRQ